MSRFRWLSLLVGGVLFCCSFSYAQTAGEESTNPIETSLCEITKNPQKYHGMRVRFRAAFESDGLEHSVLVDTDCKRGIIPWTADDVEHNPDVEALEHAIAAGRRGTTDKHIVGTFTGKFMRKEKPSPSGTLVLEIEKIDNLEITAKPSSRQRGSQKKGEPTANHESLHAIQEK